MNNKTKKYLKLFASFALVGAVAVSLTLALLSTITETKTNTFTSNKGITGTIEEPDWDFDNNVWEDYLPGESHGKNPYVTVNSEDGDITVAVAVRVLFKDNDGNEIDYDQFADNYGQVSYQGNDGFNINDWEKDETNSGIFYYKTTIKASSGTEATTSELFDTVTVNSNIKRVYTTTTANQTIKVYETNPDGSKGDLLKEQDGGTVLVNSTDQVFIVDASGNVTQVDPSEINLPSFEILVTGYAVQAENQDIAGPITNSDKQNLLNLSGL